MFVPGRSNVGLIYSAFPKDKLYGRIRTFLKTPIPRYGVSHCGWVVSPPLGVVSTRIQRITIAAAPALLRGSCSEGAARYRLGFGHHDSGAGFTADADGEFRGLLARHFAADDHAPEGRRASVGGRDAGFGEEVFESGAQGFGTRGIGEGSGLNGVAGSRRRCSWRCVVTAGGLTGVVMVTGGVVTGRATGDRTARRLRWAVRWPV